MVDGALGARITPGQPHDRIQIPGDAASAAMPAPKPASSAAGDASTNLEPEVTLSQKMLSAVGGSIFTSLLVTPLDVVRVRLQSQSAPPTFNEIRVNSSTPFPRSFSNLPPNLGVTACCREVFWVNNNSPYCVVGEGTVVSSINPSATSAASDIAAANAECAVEETQRKTFTSTLDGLRKIARNEGFTTLWRGLSPTLVMAVPGNVIYFAGYDWLRTSAKSPLKNRVSETYAPLIAGSTARVIAAFFVSPIELFRTRMQASQGGGAVSHFRETASGVTEMVRSQGYHTLWRGLTLTLWRDVPFSALYWWGYEFTRNAITDVREGSGEELRGRWGASPAAAVADTMSSRASSRNQQNRTTTLVDSFAAGAISGGVASVITTPFDVGKTRQQVFRHAGDSQTAVPEAMKTMRLEEQSMPRFLLQIFKDEGVAGLFRGWAARVLKVAPACAIMISTYEMGKKMAADMREPDAD